MSALTLREWLVQIRTAVIGIGTMIALLSILALDPSIKAAPEVGLIMAFGVGLVLGWPGGRVHGNLRSDKFRAVAWLLVDLAVRVALIIAVEILLRHFEWRYAFKARVAVAVMTACFFTYPWMSRDADKAAKTAKYSASYLALTTILGLCFFSAAALIYRDLGPFATLGLGSIALSLISTTICTVVDIRSGKPNLALLVLAIGFAATLAAGWPLAGAVSIAGALIYTATTILLCVAHDSMYRQESPPRQRELQEVCPPNQAQGGAK